MSILSVCLYLFQTFSISISPLSRSVSRVYLVCLPLSVSDFFNQHFSPLSFCLTCLSCQCLSCLSASICFRLFQSAFLPSLVLSHVSILSVCLYLFQTFSISISPLSRSVSRVYLVCLPLSVSDFFNQHFSPLSFCLTCLSCLSASICFRLFQSAFLPSLVLSHVSILFVGLPICLSACLSVCLSVCQSVYLSTKSTLNELGTEIQTHKKGSKERYLL